MQINHRADGYDISEADGAFTAEISRLPGLVRPAGSGWKIDYTGDPRKDAALDKKMNALKAKAEKLEAVAIASEPQQLGEIPLLPELLVQLPVRRPLYRYQEPGVAFCLEHHQGTIIGDQPGLGKTSQAAAFLLAGRVIPDFQTLPALIICPTTIKRKWQAELMTVAGYKALILTDKTKNSWPYFVRSGMVDAVIVNYESLLKYFVQAVTTPQGEALRLKDIVFRPEVREFKTVIIDELHKCKDAGTRQAKICKGLTAGVPNVLGLTGTMLVNSPEDLASQLSIINRIHEFGGYRRFKARYCTKLKNAAGELVFPNLEELNYLLATRCYYRREKKEVLTDLPDKTRQVVSVDITTRAEYDKAEAEFETYLKTYKACTDAQVRRKMRAKFLVQMGVLSEISARGKLQAWREWRDNLVESGEKVVTFCTLQDLIQTIKKTVPRTLEISGQVTGDQRDRNVKLFQTSPHYTDIVLNIKAGGVGIDLFAASHVGFLELAWTFADSEQCEDRCHRNGQKSPVFAAYFLGRDTVDEYRYKKIQDKKEIANKVHGAVDEVREEEVDSLLDFFEGRKKRTHKTAELWN